VLELHWQLFTSQEAQSALGISPDVGKLVLNRVEKKSFVASRARSFYVIVPPEYRSLGCLPVDQLIPALMRCLDLRLLLRRSPCRVCKDGGLFRFVPHRHFADREAGFAARRFLIGEACRCGPFGIATDCLA
jgi:hypothetical protein